MEIMKVDSDLLRSGAELQWEVCLCIVVQEVDKPPPNGH